MLAHGDVHTMDPQHPHAQAVAIRGDKIIYVGSDDGVRDLVGPHTDVRDLAGKTVTPGLVDAHAHPYGLGVDLESVDLRDLPSEKAAADKVRDAAHKLSANEWLLGRGWDQNKWASKSFPGHQSLDAIPQPVILTRIDGHAIWVNRAALNAAKVTKDTRDPAGGKIVRGSGGQPTGVLVDNAKSLVESAMPAPTPDVRERRILNALSKLPPVGMTGVHEMGIEPETAAVYEKLAAQGRLPVHVYAFLLGDPAHPVTTAPKPAIGHFAMRGVKYYADGALGSRGARLYADYTDDKGNRGLWVTDPATLATGVEAAVSKGWQVATHAIGDAGVGSVLDAYLAATKAHPSSTDLRLRVEHLQIIAPDDEPKLVAAHATASMQPTHATSDMPWAEARLGPTRVLGAYAWRKMLALHVPLAFGSDFPVERISPLLGIYSAVTRQDHDGKPPGGWYPDQRMTLDEAIAAFTTGAAYASFGEATHGTLAPRMAADITVFDRPLKPAELDNIGVEMTIVDGKIVYQHKPGDPNPSAVGGTGAED